MKIPIDKLSQGMKLTEDVLDTSGATLATEGTELTGTLIGLLKSKGITEVVIQDRPAEGPCEQDAAASESDLSKGITVAVAADSMSASIRIDPQENSGLDLTEDAIIEVLNENGVVSGIQQSIVGDLAKKWRAEKRLLEHHGIAQGTPPKPGAQSSLEIQVPCITDRGQLELARKATHCWELKASGIKFHRVRPGDLIAKKGPPKPGTPGRNVLGAEVEPKAGEELKIQCDATAEYVESEEKVVAKEDGLAYCIEETVGVVPISFDGSVEVTVAGDKMQAELAAHPAVEGGRPPTGDAVREMLTKQGVVSGVHDDVLADLVQKMAKGTYPVQPVVIAEGTQPVNGDDGRIEFLFNAETSLQPKKNSDGSVDFHEVSIVHAVTEGTPLARRIAPTGGMPGKDVLGNEVPAKAGTDVLLPAGNGTRVSADDPEVLVAETDGNARFTGKVVEVAEGFTVEGDVDFSTGNVRYNKSVSVGGDIKAGFEVDCDGDLQVGGVVEDTKLRVGGNVLIKAGFVGRGGGLLEADGDVNISFVHGQTVKAKGHVTIAKEALDCKIYARKSVTVLGEPLSTVSSIIVARDSIEVRTAGNLSGAKTELQVGVDYTLADEMRGIDETLAQHAENNQKLVQIVQKHEAIAKTGRNLGAKAEELYNKVKATLETHAQEEKKLREKKKELEKKSAEIKNCFIKVQHAAHPGTVFRIGDQQMRVQDEIVGPKTVQVMKGEVQVV
ncbi:MAG: DUF342 domain-containing protein [Chitinivibrionales bacterium]|nr:DUF342 domain-containing protein [Chitinivibrionales bacterium]MBD3394266.1 DUF342 domain-containing protein [Chitinivibrionales bacterium]